MRLIDGDALNKELQKRVGSPTDDKLYEVNLCIINAPTIPAIPVEWLIQRQDEAYRAVYYCGGNVEKNAEIMGAIRTVLELWQKEQEGK